MLAGVSMTPRKLVHLAAAPWQGTLEVDVHRENARFDCMITDGGLEDTAVQASSFQHDDAEGVDSETGEPGWVVAGRAHRRLMVDDASIPSPAVAIISPSAERAARSVGGPEGLDKNRAPCRTGPRQPGVAEKGVLLRRMCLVRATIWAAGVATVVVGGVLVARYVDREALQAAWVEMRADPLGLGGAMVAYVAAFVVRGVIWRRVVPGLSLGHAVSAIHVTLLGNHLLPLRLGEPLRAASVAARAGVPIGSAIASTVTMRAADILGVAVLGLILGPGILVSLLGPWGLGIMTAGALVAGIAWIWWLRRRYGGHEGLGSIRMPGGAVAVGALAAWVLESVLMWQSARWVGWPISPAAAIVATAITVGAQIAALAPAGFGTFEAAGTASLVAVGMPAGRALAVTLTVHAVTTVYSLVAGAVALVLPPPAMRPSLLFRALQAPARRGVHPGVEGSA